MRRVYPRGQHIIRVSCPGDRTAADWAAMFFERHDVGHYLTRMRAPREPIDYWDCGVFGQIHKRAVLKNADHDGIDVAREYARGVGDGLSATKLHFLTGEIDRLAA